MILKTIHFIPLILIVGMLISCNGQGNTTTHKTELNSSENDKSTLEIDHQIWAIHQDSKGNHWFGSNGNGIYQFDGKTLRQFTSLDGLVDDQIRGIQEDTKGNIYVETPKGVSKFDGTKFTTLSVTKSPKNQWKLEPNDLWFNCNGNANHVYRYDGETLYELQLPKKDLMKAFEIYEQTLTYSPYTVFGIDKDQSGNLWLGTVLAGAFRFDGESFLWIGEKELSRLPDGREPGVRCILEDSDGYIWLSNFKSKYKIQPKSTNEYEKLKAVYPADETVREKLLYFNSGLSDMDGNLWMTTYGGGVWKYDGETLSNIEIKNEMEDVTLICIYQDNNGTIWLGTNNDGVYRQVGNNFEKFEPKI